MSSSMERCQGVFETRFKRWVNQQGNHTVRRFLY